MSNKLTCLVVRGTSEACLRRLVENANVLEVRKEYNINLMVFVIKPQEGIIPRWLQWIVGSRISRDRFDLDHVLTNGVTDRSNRAAERGANRSDLHKFAKGSLFDGFGAVLATKDWLGCCSRSRLS